VKKFCLENFDYIRRSATRRIQVCINRTLYIIVEKVGYILNSN